MIIFTGGKTAGHIYPLIVLMKEVKKKIDLYWI
jgi:UDP-N-acetylglucosamine:LPS N-acetylglucosamine transferase